MTLDGLIKTIENSDASDWRVIQQPIFTQEMSAASNGSGQHWVEVREHYKLLVYEKDLSISIAMGFPDNDRFQEKWANEFADPNASSTFVDFRYNGVPVLREITVHVDGDRARLPLPKSSKELEVSRRQSAVWRLFDEISGSGKYDEYLGRAGIKETDAKWPR
ncbi:hypothetical protein [Bradyrhizobium sp. Cp5.3]|uniref:hypothetical protein n=1 Tax=Bradyrhizobium sp. Cp5.3 TaxID=443598 RepID=UPI000401B129|nr:hypothetical protein [Bradyrhizobium sp. Cp5.3]